VEVEFDRQVECRRRGADRHLGAPGGVAFGAHADVVIARRNVVELKPAILVGAHFTAQLVDHDQRAAERQVALGLRDAAAQRGPGGGLGQR
jgi:hypothetical protein